MIPSWSIAGLPVFSNVTEDEQVIARIPGDAVYPVAQAAIYAKSLAPTDLLAAKLSRFCANHDHSVTGRETFTGEEAAREGLGFPLAWAINVPRERLALTVEEAEQIRRGEARNLAKKQELEELVDELEAPTIRRKLVSYARETYPHIVYSVEACRQHLAQLAETNTLGEEVQEVVNNAFRVWANSVEVTLPQLADSGLLLPLQWAINMPRNDSPRREQLNVGDISPRYDDHAIGRDAFFSTILQDNNQRFYFKRKVPLPLPDNQTDCYKQTVCDVETCQPGETGLDITYGFIEHGVVYEVGITSQTACYRAIALSDLTAHGDRDFVLLRLWTMSPEEIDQLFDLVMEPLHAAHVAYGIWYTKPHWIDANLAMFTALLAVQIELWDRPERGPTPRLGQRLFFNGYIHDYGTVGTFTHDSQPIASVAFRQDADGLVADFFAPTDANDSEAPLCAGRVGTHLITGVVATPTGGSLILYWYRNQDANGEWFDVERWVMVVAANNVMFNCMRIVHSEHDPHSRHLAFGQPLHRQHVGFNIDGVANVLSIVPRSTMSYELAAVVDTAFSASFAELPMYVVVARSLFTHLVADCHFDTLPTPTLVVDNNIDGRGVVDPATHSFLPTLTIDEIDDVSNNQRQLFWWPLP